MKKPIIFKKRGRIWYFRRADEPTFHSTGCTTEAARDVWMLEHPEKPTSKTLEDFARDFFREGSPWIARQHAKKRPFGKAQAKNRQGHLDHHILPRWGKTMLSEITKPDIEDWLLTLDLENATRNAIMYTLRILLREAKGRNLIAQNPLQETEPRRKNE